MEDAMRAMDQKGCIASDFVLITGGTVTNFDLSVALQKWKHMREKDKNASLALANILGTRDHRFREGNKSIVHSIHILLQSSGEHCWICNTVILQY